MRRILPPGRALVLIAVTLAVASLAPPNGAAAKVVLKTLHQFCSQVAEHRCTDGDGPQAGLIADAAGNLYGTTGFGGAGANGGTYGGGTVFELAPPPAGGTEWTETVLYSFCSQAGCTDGNAPAAGLLLDASGNLYGTTSAGGANGGGAVFELAPPAAGQTEWSETVLYSFCSQGGKSCTDGDGPLADLITDAVGNLYGTTAYGGAQGGGTVFELTPPPVGGTEWTATVLHNFCSLGSQSCVDGVFPFAGLIMDAKGNLYGTTYYGGDTMYMGVGGGTVFELTPPPAGGTEWTETVLYNFCSRGGENCTDGEHPRAGLIMDAKGNLHSTTNLGGGGEGGGTVFVLTPGTNTKWRETVLYSFCSKGGGDCTDGAYPYAGLITDAVGNLYGTTVGPGLGGMAFELTHTAGIPWRQTVLYGFCSKPHGKRCADGKSPEAGLILDASGDFLYGTTARTNTTGGHPRGGTVFELRR